MARAEDGLANHRVSWLADTRGLDLHTDHTGSRPIMFQIALELARRQSAASVSTRILVVVRSRMAE
jgi:hypothetical protein